MIAAVRIPKQLTKQIKIKSHSQSLHHHEKTITPSGSGDPMPSGSRNLMVATVKKTKQVRDNIPKTKLEMAAPRRLVSGGIDMGEGATGWPQPGQLAAWGLICKPHAGQLISFMARCWIGGVGAGEAGSDGGASGAGRTSRVLSGKNSCWQVGHFTRSNCASSAISIVCPQPGQSNRIWFMVT